MTASNEFENNGGNPFVLLWMGQSNAKGSSEPYGGDQTIEQGVYIWNGIDFVVPQFGVNPLSTSGSNNACISCANELKKVLGRDIYIILNAEGGQSIAEWIGDTPHLWDDLILQLSTSGISLLPKSVIGIGWMQGESDSTTIQTGYDTYDTYKNGLYTLIDNLREMPCIGSIVPFISSGIGEWEENGSSERNDVLLTLNDDNNIWNGNISQTDLHYSDISGVVHFDGDSLVKIGKRVAAKILTAPFNIGEENKSLNDLGVFTNENVQIQPYDLKNGAQLSILNCSIKVPLAFRYTGSTLRILVLSESSLVCDQGIRINNIEYSSLILNRVGVWEFVSINNRLQLLSCPSQGSNIEFNIGEYSIDESQIMLDESVYCARDALIHLPAPMAHMTGKKVTFFAWSITSGGFGDGKITIDTGIYTGKFIDKNGAVVNSIQLSSYNACVNLKCVRNKWVVSN